jgi:cephalosporin hydroxylase
MDKQPTKYKEIDGWFNFEDAYNEIAERLNPFSKYGDIIVEVGSYKGKSTVYMAELLQLKFGISQIPDFFAVDVWEGEVEKNGSLYPSASFKEFYANLEQAEVEEYVAPLRMHSIAAANLFKGHSVSALFLDGDHSYEALSEELRAWYPKVSKDGYFIGHDSNWGSVRLAVRHFCEEYGLEYSTMTHKHCWELHQDE